MRWVRWLEAVVRRLALLAAGSTTAAERAQQSAAAEDGVLGMMLLVLLGIGCIAPVWALWHWHGRWRVAAAVALVFVGFVVARIVVGTAIDPTSHNLWPLEVLMADALAALAIGVLRIARRVIGVSE